MASKQALPVVVIGGGVSGMTVAIEAAEAGASVLLIEKEPFLGGKVMGLHQFYPKLSTPESGIDMHLRRIRGNSRITVLTGTEVLKLGGSKGNFTLDLLARPRMVNERCTVCHKCAEVCPVEVPDPRNNSRTITKAIRLSHKGAYPYRYMIDEKACRKEACAKCREVCEPGAIDLSEEPRAYTINAATVVVATGWEPFDARKLKYLGFGTVPNVISNVMMERKASPDGPTGGAILRPSDKRPARSIVFVQCAGQRDKEHLPYCSAICCLVSFKQAYYVRQANPDAQVTIIYTDLTNPCPGRYDKFISRIIDDERVAYARGKVTAIREDHQTGDAILTIADPADPKAAPREMRAEMAVLATGMVPSLLGGLLKDVVVLDEHGFMKPEYQKEGVYVTGVAKNPGDVTSSMLDAAYTALRTIQGIRQ